MSGANASPVGRSGFAQEVDFQARELPAWVRRGGRDQRKCREASSTERTGRSTKFKQKNLFWNLIDRPVCARQGSFAKFLEHAATPPDPGGELSRLKIAFLSVNARGFTLIEVLVAMTILTAGFAILFSLSSRSLEGMRRVEDSERRIAFAREKLEQLKLLSDIEAGDRASGSLTDGTHWSIEVTPFIPAVLEGTQRNPDTVVHVRVSLNWQGRTAPQAWFVDAYRLVHPRSANAIHSSLESQLNVFTR